MEPHLEGNELVNKMYRWDQRLYTVLLQLPGLLNNGGSGGDSGRGEGGEKEYSAVHKSVSSLCEATGGESENVTIKTAILI